MSVVACEVPPSSALDRHLIDAAYFHDAYRAPLSREPASVIDIFFAIFGHHPKWMKLVLIMRNRIASACGLAVAEASEIMRPDTKESYAMGDNIRPWPIFFLSNAELIAGRDNKHLDFRLLVLKESYGAASTVISTICTTHNAFGKLYLFFIIPFHKWGVRRLMSRAIISGRL